MKIKTSLALFGLLALLGACNVAQQLNQLKNFALCDFRLTTMENTTLAGVNVQQIHSLTDLNLLQAGKISAAYAAGSLPLDFILNIEVKNPNTSVAAMNGMEWILLIDDLEVTNGAVTDRLEIAPNNGLATLPLHIRTDLKKVLAGKSAEAAINFGMNLVGTGNRPSRLTLKVKPSIMVGTTAISYPGYLSVKNEFGGTKQTTTP